MSDEVYTMGLLNRFAAIIVGPGLLLGWWLTGQSAYFTFYKVLVGLSTLGFSAILLHVVLQDIQRRQWRSPALGQFIRRYMWLTLLSWLTSAGCAIFLFFVHKNVIGWLVLINLTMYVLFRYTFLRGDIDVSQREKSYADNLQAVRSPAPRQDSKA